ncbi:MAG: transposase [Pseudomonadota bacterium]
MISPCYGATSPPLTGVWITRQQNDPLPERVVEQVLLGVSTRGYAQSLEPLPEGIKARGTSKSAASRHLVEQTKAKLQDKLRGRLDGVEPIALMIDGIEIAGHVVVVALGITLDGRKVPLGIALGSTENAAVCTTLLQDMIERGLVVQSRILCVIDGGKGIRKALNDVLGSMVIVQRCQLHKIRNVLSHLPKKRQPHIRRAMRGAYKSSTVVTARRLLKNLANSLERDGEEDAAASLREGMEETLTVIKLGLPETLRRSLSTTNAIENIMGTVRRVSRNVKNWRNGAMAKRWVSLGVTAAERRFRRIKGHRFLSQLRQVLRKAEKQLDADREAA